MTTFVHALRIDTDKCAAKLGCIRVCPTAAIRVRNGAAEINPTLCIDCGECIGACSQGAIQPITDTWEDVERFPFKVAITAPTLYGQFPMAITPADVAEGLLALGFDAVYDMSVESVLIHRAIQDYLDEYHGPLPLISSICPVIVRLIQVSYPDMVDQIIPIEPPREIAGREVHRRYSEKLGIPPEEIGAIYIAPCPAKMISIKQPAEGAKSNLDLAIGIKDIYNPLLAAITKRMHERGSEERPKEFNIGTPLFLELAMTGGQSNALRQSHSISVAQLPHVIRIFDDVEKGKIRTAQFLEAYACTGGCVGGPLTVDERFVARSKLRRLAAEVGSVDEKIAEEIACRYEKDSYFLRQPVRPRPVSNVSGGLREQIKRVKVRDQYLKLFPGIDCGLCGSPTCEVFAGDVANGESEPEDCVLISSRRLESLRGLYGIDPGALPNSAGDV
ncbi:MAG: hypothetical protein GF355_08635 [Candidatus Eisenbacteria bacterium]|nr:hypothetical protein [Candidatus Eisenbacteria bacterium]